VPHFSGSPLPPPTPLRLSSAHTVGFLGRRSVPWIASCACCRHKRLWRCERAADVERVGRPAPSNPCASSWRPCVSGVIYQSAPARALAVAVFPPPVLPHPPRPHRILVWSPHSPAPFPCYLCASLVVAVPGGTGTTRRTGRLARLRLPPLLLWRGHAHCDLLGSLARGRPSLHPHHPAFPGSRTSTHPLGTTLRTGSPLPHNSRCVPAIRTRGRGCGGRAQRAGVSCLPWVWWSCVSGSCVVSVVHSRVSTCRVRRVWGVGRSGLRWDTPWPGGAVDWSG